MILIPVRRKKIPLFVKILVYGLKIVGLAPFSVLQSKSPTNNPRLRLSGFGFSKIGLIYNIVLSILMGLASVPAFPKLIYSKYSNKSSSVVVIDLFHTILFIFTSVAVIISWSLKQRKASHILNNLLKLDSMLSATSEPCKQWYLVRLAGHITVSTLLWTFTSFASETTRVNGFVHWLLLHSSRIVVYCFIAEYSIVLGVLTEEIKTVNNALSNFKTLLHRISSTSSQLAYLQWLHSIRTSISEVALEISDFFSLLVFPSVASLFVSIVGNAFYIVTPLVTSIPFLPLVTSINTVVWLSICFYPIVLLSSNVTETLKEVTR